VKKQKKMGASLKKLDDILKESDFVSLHIPHNEGTHYILNEKNLVLMKPNAYLINCARGGTVDEKALFRLLKEGKIAGASIDVFESEPPKDSPFINLDNVVLTPHIGASTKEGQIKAGTVCADQIVKVLKGKEPDHCVNKKFM